MRTKGELWLEENGSHYELHSKLNDNGITTIIALFYDPDENERALLDTIVTRHNAFEPDSLVDKLVGALEKSLAGLEYFQSKGDHLTLPITLDVMDKDALRANIKQTTEALASALKMRGEK